MVQGRTLTSEFGDRASPFLWSLNTFLLWTLGMTGPASRPLGPVQVFLDLQVNE